MDVHLRGEDGGNTHDMSCQFFDVNRDLIRKQTRWVHAGNRRRSMTVLEELTTSSLKMSMQSEE
jgi:hypothetical protein